MTVVELELTTQMIVVITILGITVVLFVLDIFRVDVVAILVMVALGLSALWPDYNGLVPADRLFDGFKSNAVMSIIAVMILGAAIDKTNALNRLSSIVLKVAGRTEQRIMACVAGTVGTISGFMQNIGAAALFLPVIDRISKQTNIPLSRLLMPMGFCAILGGTLTMIGSSPLIMLNDLVAVSVDDPSTVQRFSLFSVTPIGLILLTVGVCYFLFFGKYVFPRTMTKGLETGTITKYVKDVYGISGQVFELNVPRGSIIAGRKIGELEDEWGFEERIIGVRSNGKVVVEPARRTEVPDNCMIAMMGHQERISKFADEYGLELKKQITAFQEAFNPVTSGIAEVVVPPQSNLIGKTMGELGFRRVFGVTLLAVYRDDRPIRQNLMECDFHAGDSLIIHCLWTNLERFRNENNVVVVTDYPRDDFRPEKFRNGMLFFALTIGLVLFTELKLSIALMTGALGMILTGVIKIDEAYRAINWQSVFLLACLFPLGIAVKETDTAAWIAQQFLLALQGAPEWVFLLALGMLGTGFSLFISNVGATVLLVPIAVSIAVSIGADPAVFGLIVALATSNSFLIPTHQVNALIQGPGGYRVVDFMRAGGVMTVLFLIVVIIMVQMLY